MKCVREREVQQKDRISDRERERRRERVEVSAIHMSLVSRRESLCTNE